MDPLDQCVKHWEIAHNNGDEGFPDGPLSRLRCAARPSLPPKSAALLLSPRELNVHLL